jgi:molybdopterin-binding protein
MKISARNQLKGTIRELKLGPVSTEVVIELPSGQLITSIITRSAADRLNLKAGIEVYAIVKATNVMVALDE